MGHDGDVVSASDPVGHRALERVAWFFSDAMFFCNNFMRPQTEILKVNFMRS